VFDELEFRREKQRQGCHHTCRPSVEPARTVPGDVHYGLRCGAREGGCGRGVAHDVVPYYYTLLYYPPLLSFSLLP
jgi:hypothetical protein